MPTPSFYCVPADRLAEAIDMLDAVTHLIGSAQDLHAVDPNALATLLNVIGLALQATADELHTLRAA